MQITINRLIDILFLSMLFRGYALCQDEYSRDTVDAGEYDEGYYQQSDSGDDFYPDYYRIILSPGFSKSDDMKLSTYSKKFYVNLSYAISSFQQPLEYYPNQVGFYNEIGFYNTSVYLNIGPEVRLFKNFYFIPYAGITFIPFSKYPDEEWSLVYYFGTAAGYIVNVNEDVAVILEASSDILRLKNDGINSYVRVGFSYNLYYPF